MPELQFNTVINAPADVIFNLIADLKRYSTWLSPSGTYAETGYISDDPVKLGTTYMDKGSSAVLKGEVAEFQPPTRITFQQVSRFKRLIFTGTLNIDIQYTLNPDTNGTYVNRTVTLSAGGILKLAQPLIANTIRKESERVLHVMKSYLESRQSQEANA